MTTELLFLAKVAEFELTASTLRANSSALSLSKKLVIRSAPDVFEALKDFRPRPRPKVPERVMARMDAWIRTREDAWKRKEEEVSSINARRMRRFVSRREQLRELMPVWEEERVQALADASADAPEYLDIIDKKVFGWTQAKHQALKDAEFERSWREREGTLDADSRDDELAEYQFYLSAWRKNWALAWMSSSLYENEMIDSWEYARERASELEKDRARMEEMEEGWERELEEERDLWQKSVDAGEGEVVRMRRLILRQGMEVGAETEIDEARREARKKVRELGKQVLREKEKARGPLQFVNKTREHFSELGTSDEWSEKLGWWEEHFKRQLWDDGWLVRLREEREWLQNDQKDYGDDWSPSARSELQFWWEDVKEWEERVAWRMLVIDEFEETSMELLRELGKIDGSSAACEFNVFSTSSFAYEEMPRHLVGDRIAGMKVAMGRGNEEEFIRSFELALGSIGDVMRSKEMKQGNQFHFLQRVSYLIKILKIYRARDAAKKARSLQIFLHGLRDRRDILLQHYGHDITVLFSNRR